MYRPSKRIYITMLWLLAPLTLFTACGKDSSSTDTTGAAAGVGACSPGQVLGPQNQCLTPTQGISGNNTMYYNGQLITVSCWSGTVMTQNGCQSSAACQNNGQYGSQYGYQNCGNNGGGYYGGGYQQCQNGQQTMYYGHLWVCNGGQWYMYQ
jgi:hypothetical protein